MQWGLVLPFRVIFLPIWWYTRRFPEIPWKGGTLFRRVTTSTSNSTKGRLFLARTCCCWEKGRRLWGEVYYNGTGQPSPLYYYRSSKIFLVLSKMKCKSELTSCYPCGLVGVSVWHTPLPSLASVADYCWVSESLLLMLLFNMDDNPTLAVAIHQQLGFQKASSTCSICVKCVIMMALGALLLKRRLTGKDVWQGLA